MATWVSNGAQTGGSGSYVAGTQSVQYCHDTFAATGDTITMPAGTPTWTGTLTLTKAITLQGAGMTTTTIGNNTSGADMIDATSGTAGHIILQNFGVKQIISGATTVFSLSLDRNDATSYTVICKSLQFDQNGIFNYSVNCSANGLIFSNCTFIGSGVNGSGGVTYVCQKYGRGIDGSPYGWNTASTMGALDTTGLRNTYLEGCTFSNGPTTMTNADDNSRVVVRYSTVIDSLIGTHGQDSSLYGFRHMEIYNCIFKNVNASALNVNAWMGPRGATVVYYNNQIDQPPTSKHSYDFSVQQINRLAGPEACQVAYPANRQVGRGWSSTSSATSGHPVLTDNGTGEVYDPCYIWGNTAGPNSDGSGLIYYTNNQYQLDDCGNSKLIQVDFTGNVTSGSNQITSVAITTTPPSGFVTPTISNNITLNMGIYDATGTYFAQGTTITAISGTTLTVSNIALANGTTKPFSTGFITLGVDVIFGTAKPGYSAYTYPHPLVSGTIQPSLSGTVAVTGIVNPTLTGGAFIQATLRVSLVYP